MSIHISFPNSDTFWSKLSSNDVQVAFNAILANINADTALKIAETNESEVATSKMMNSSNDNDDDDDNDDESWRHR